MNDEKVRIYIKKGPIEIEIEGEQGYVDSKIEELGEKYFEKQSELIENEEEEPIEQPNKDWTASEIYSKLDKEPAKIYRALFLGWYLEKIDKKEDFNKIEIEDKALKNKIELGKNLSRDLNYLREKGLLKEIDKRDGEPTYYLTRTGENYVEEEIGIKEIMGGEIDG